ncbi:checkpoint clamp complex protein Rad1 [Exophiala xenobiotica]|nr:checkpoint clamp complex protein Rad1 [Exophiala xenobiotica]KAK5228111.1 checkpoint clamp complex protein Rad1 [Exophiala xenobiotica]KAK5302453.1 checkpoint clamp complex protein Rad1 [Exophiala xenobiotica]KAK5317799.1 checkpoint clamp complex protein Rad1 [Exophiala xenobiotica]KAK5388279.1 checkpoint clamp complex protein Rad1 [Exophiala xenobiotica]
MASAPIFTAVTTSARQLHLLLRCISFSPRAEVQITQSGIRFSVEEARVLQGLTFLDKALFSTYNLNLTDEEHSLPPFSISIVALLETLQIFGIAEATSSARNAYGGFSSSYGNAFTAPALAAGGTCRISYQEAGAPLTITIQEGSVTTTCEMNTYEAHGEYEDDGGIPLNRNALCLKAIMRSTWLHDAITELSGTNPTVLVLNASSRSAPYFALEGEGGPFGDSTVDFMPESKNEPTPSGTRGKKQPLVTETFSVIPPSGHSRFKQRYKFDMIKRAGRAMALGSKVSIRQDQQGVLSLQFMIDLGDGANSGPRRDENNGSVNAPPSPGTVAFVDFRFVPLVGDDEDGESDPETETQENTFSE